MNEKRRSRLILLLKLVITAALMVVVIRKTDLRQMPVLARNCNLFYLGVGILAFLASQLLMVLNWWFILKSKAYLPPYLELLRLHFIGLFYNQFLPTSIGGDVVKGLYLAGTIKSRAESFSSLVVIRLLGLVAMFMLLVLGMLLQSSIFSHSKLFQVLGVFLITVSALLIFFYLFARFSRAAQIHDRADIFDSVFHKIRAFLSALKDYRRKPHYLAGGVVLALGVHFLIIVENFFIAQALSIHVGMKFFILAVPMVIAITLLPISISGLGIREGSFVFLFSLVGVSSSEAVAFSLIGYFVLLGLGIAGGLVNAVVPRIEPKEALQKTL